jgi:hypothetical protein
VRTELPLVGESANTPPPHDPQQLLDRYHAAMYRAVDALMRIPQTADGVGAFIRSADYVDRQLLFATSQIAAARDQVVAMVQLAGDEEPTELVERDINGCDIFGRNADRPAGEGGVA